jgi:hypothetical protein
MYACSCVFIYSVALFKVVLPLAFNFNDHKSVICHIHCCSSKCCMGFHYVCICGHTHIKMYVYVCVHMHNLTSKLKWRDINDNNYWCFSCQKVYGTNSWYISKQKLHIGRRCCSGNACPISFRYKPNELVCQNLKLQKLSSVKW